MTTYKLNGNIDNPSEVLQTLNDLDNLLGQVEGDVEELHSQNLTVELKINKNALSEDSTDDVIRATIKDA